MKRDARGSMAHTNAVLAKSRAELRAEKLARLGAPSQKDAAELSLATFLDCYDRLMAQLPKNSNFSAVVAGAFGHAPDVARQVLEVA